MLANHLVCEYKLPIVFSDFTEAEKEDFKEIQWNELTFYTASFFDKKIDEDFGWRVVNYTISEDGLFYKNETEVNLIQNDEGKIETKERDKGLERIDFTGEIFFGTEIFGESNDYTVTFRALFFKGDLKELDLEEWKKEPNEDRKKAEKKVLKVLREENEKARRSTYKFFSLLKLCFFKLFGIPVWIFLHLFKIFSSIQRWVIR